MTLELWRTGPPRRFITEYLNVSEEDAAKVVGVPCDEDFVYCVKPETGQEGAKDGE